MTSPTAPRLCLLKDLPRGPSGQNKRNMDHQNDSQFGKKRENRTRAPTACQTCRVRKTRCDNIRPICSYCAHQRAQCIYPDTISLPFQAVSDPANEIREGIAHIISLVEDLKQGKELAVSSNSFQFPQPGHKVTHRSSPRTDATENQFGDQLQGSSASSVQGVHDPKIDTRVVFSAISPEVILRWPIFKNVIHEEDIHIHSFVLDFIDKQTELQARMQAEMQAKLPRHFQSKQANTEQYLGNLSYLCERYLTLVHHSLPVVEAEEIRRFALEVAMHGLGWDGKTCLVLLACALGCIASTFPEAPKEPLDVDNMPELSPIAVDITLADTYFDAARQRLGFLGSSLRDVQSFMLAGLYHRFSCRPLDAWYCGQQASSRLLLCLRSSKRERWVADFHYHKMESRLYWTCVLSEQTLQWIVPLPTTPLDDLPYADQFIPSPKHVAHAPVSKDNNSNNSFDTTEEKSWRFFLGILSGCRTMETILIELSRLGTDGWRDDPKGLLERTKSALQTMDEWYQVMSSNVLPVDKTWDHDYNRSIHLRHFLWLVHIHRPVVYLALHYHMLPSSIQRNPHVTQEIFEYAQQGIEICASLIPGFWFNYPHAYIWEVALCVFSAAVQILAIKLCEIQLPRLPATPALRLPLKWQGLVKVTLDILDIWAHRSVGIMTMRDILGSMYHKTCDIASYEF